MYRRHFLAGLPALAWAAKAGAQPAQTPRLSLAETGVRTHIFRTFGYDSADGKRRYRVMVALPRQPQPAKGYASLWLCDGNAALMALKAETLEAHPDLAVVALGYDTDQRFDLVARNFDYTPAVNGPQTVDELRGENRAGGADVFAALIRERIWPDMAGLGLDPARGGLWGHSYGGLFVLNGIYSCPDLFRVYISASPSLWWYEGRAFRGTPQTPASARDLLLICGDAEVNRRVINGRTLPSPEETVAELEALAVRLRQVLRLSVETRILSGLNHGPVFEASLPVAFDFAARHLKGE